MSDYQAKPPKKKHSLNTMKLRLSAPNPNAKGIYSNLSWDLYQNNPRVTVDTKDPSLSSPDNSYGRIQASLDPVIFGILMEILKEAIAADGAYKQKAEISGFEYNNGQRAQEATNTSDIWIGKDAEGQVFISVVSKKANWPIIKFVFGVSDDRWVKFIKADGTRWTKAELSIMAAKAYYTHLTNAMPVVMENNYYEAPPNPSWKNKGSGGGGNYGGGNGYAKREVPAISDDDIPF